MSIALSPSTPRPVTRATESLRMRSWNFRATSMVTMMRLSPRSGAKRMSLTEPTCRPPSRTGESSEQAVDVLEGAHVAVLLVEEHPFLADDEDHHRRQQQAEADEEAGANDDAPLPLGGVHLLVPSRPWQPRVEERTHVGVGRSLHLLHRALGHDLAVGEHRDPVGDPKRAVHVVGHHDAGCSRARSSCATISSSITRVLIGSRPVVGSSQRITSGVGGDGPREAHALAHAAREVRRAHRLDAGQVHPLQVRAPPSRRSRSRASRGSARAAGRRCCRPPMSESNSAAPWNTIATLRRTSRSSSSSSVTTSFALEQHRAAVGVEQPDQALEQHALPAARAADDGERLAFSNGQIEPVVDALLAEGLVQPLVLDQHAVRRVAHRARKSLVRKKSVRRIATEAIATVSVVARPTPSVPPSVLKPL